MSITNSDPDGVRALLLAAIPRLRRFAMSLTGTQHAGDDLTQLTLERALTRLNQFQPGTKMESWLFRIAYNAWIDEVRSTKRRGTQMSLDGIEETVGVDQRSGADARLDLMKVRAAMDLLPDDHRAVLVMVGIEGMSYQETAETLRIPIGTVMSRLSRARKALLQQLEARRNDENV